MKPRLVLPLALVAALGTWLMPGSSLANLIDPITIFDSKGNPWTVSTLDDRVVALFDTTDRTGLPPMAQTTSLFKEVVFDPTRALQPIILTLEEVNTATESYGGAAQNTTVRSGLNFIMQNNTINDTNISWDGFQETLTDRDLTPVAGGGFADAILGASFGADNHPTIAHFHTDGASFGIDKNPPPWDLVGGRGGTDGGATLIFSEPPNKLDSFQNNLFIFHVRVHDIVVDDFKRRFDLAEQPVVPEPATLLLLGSGLAGLAGVAWRRLRK